MAINQPQNLDANLRINLFLTTVQKESLPEEIFDSLAQDMIYSDRNRPPAIPNSIYWRLDAKADGAWQVRIPLIKELSGVPTLGSLGDQRLNEEDRDLKYFTAYYTDVSHAVTNQQYGIEQIIKKPYGIFEDRARALGRYFKQYYGVMRRQALLEAHSENLGEAPHFLTDAWGINWYIPNITDAQQPAYDPTYQNFTNNIVTALNTAGTGTLAAGSVHYFNRLERWARDEAFITPTEFEDGTNGYLFLIPSPTWTWMKNSNAGLATFGNLWRDVKEYNDEVKKMYPGMLGQYEGIRFILDPRYPTLTVGGSASGSVAGQAAYTLTAQYRLMGRADDGSSDPRDKTVNARMVGFLLGKGALLEWQPESMHWEWEYEQYDKYFGSGIFFDIGIMQPQFDVGENDATTMQQDSSVICPFAMPPELG